MAAEAADDVALAGDEIAGSEVADVGADRDDLADELVADDEPRLDRVLSPLVPRVDMEVGAADAGSQHPDEHLAWPRLRLGHVLQPEAWFRVRLDQRLH